MTLATPIRLICLDLDGTLIGSGGATPEAVWTAAATLRASGVRLAVCSGRPGFGIALAYAERLDVDGWHSFQNGASVLHLATRTSRSSALPAETVAWLIAHARRTGRLLELYTDTDYAIEQDVAHARAHAALLGVPFAPRPFETLAGPIVRAQWMVTHADGELALADAPATLEVAASTSPVMPDTQFINMTPPGVTKALAVDAMASAYGIPLSQVMFVGDGGNDLPAMRIVGVAVAMGNAEPAVRAAAHRVVGHVDAGGLATALTDALAHAPAARV